MAAVGNIALVFSILTMLYSIVIGHMGLKQDNWNFRESARGAALAAFLLIGIASAILWHALLTSDFSLLYVANYTKIELPWYFKFSAFWAGQAGSLLFWALLNSLLPVFLLRSRIPESIKFYSGALVQMITIAFLLILLGATPPFRMISPVPADGAGLNPQLQSLGMIIHPPITFLSFALFAVPFAIVLVSLLSKRRQPWQNWIRSWLLGAWFMLTAGIITGGQWAYTELGWGGYWAWDPVENASLFPWLTATALLHTLALQRRGRGLVRTNVALVFITYILCIFGTFLTRSGLLDSVHAFSDSRVGQLFWLMILALAAAGIVAFARGRRHFENTKDGPLLSFDGVFRILAAVLVLITVGVFIGTMMPYFSGLVGRSITLQESFYNQMTIPFWLTIIALFALTPILQWFVRPQRWVGLAFPAAAAFITAAALWRLSIGNPLALATFALSAGALSSTALDAARNRKRRAAHLIHIGVIVIAVGIAGSVYNQEIMAEADPGDVLTLGRYELRYSGLDTEAQGLYTFVASTLDVFRSGTEQGTVTSRKTFHPTYRQPATDIGILGSLGEDIYFNLAGWDHDTAILQVSVKPLVAWIWIGSYLMYIGSGWLWWKAK